MTIKNEKADTVSPVTKQNAPTSDRVIEFQVRANPQPVSASTKSAKPATNQPDQRSVMSPKPLTPLSKPRPAAATATPKPAKQEPKDSKFKSVLKKTGRILKKPF
jgi:hypothetical protein